MGNGQLFRSRYVWVSSKIFDSVVMVTQVAYTNGESCWFETANSPRQSVWRGGSVFQYHVYHINNKSVQDSKKHVLLLSFSMYSSSGLLFVAQLYDKERAKTGLFSM